MKSLSAEFDVAVSAEKNNPYSRVTQNQTLTDLWKMGLFRKDTVEESILILESLHLDGKEKLIEGLKKLQQNSADNAEVVGG